MGFEAFTVLFVVLFGIAGLTAAAMALFGHMRWLQPAGLLALLTTMTGLMGLFRGLVQGVSGYYAPSAVETQILVAGGLSRGLDTVKLSLLLAVVTVVTMLVASICARLRNPNMSERSRFLRRRRPDSVVA